ncbi:MAG TPA: cbb3-type cytochrome c oxidase N-terminal domain-containing protein [Rariglobus sp.]|nr:cbb3-type cytochrome c oxidase N-terminal domain-containing protein [Rariglobus sp.]
MNPNKPDQQPGEDPIREHVFDGIAEYDRRLPNWWLVTLYASIVFAILYWMVTQHFSRSTDETRMAAEMQRIEAAKMAASANAPDDATLWKMSRNAVFVDAGRATFQSTCASCHNAALTGGIGPNLVDTVWIHGSKPTDVEKTVTEGVLAKGMPNWGPVLGGKKVSEVVAFILSHHAEP